MEPSKKRKLSKTQVFTTFLQELILQIGTKDLNSQFCLKRMIKSCNFSQEYLDNFMTSFVSNSKDDLKIDWDEISDLKLKPSFISKYKEYLNWKRICKTQVFTESFLLQHLKYLDWDTISVYQKLSDDFIVAHNHKLNWTNLFLHQKLSKKIIDDYQHKLNGKHIYQQEILFKVLEANLEDKETIEDLEEIAEDLDDHSSNNSLDTDEFIVSE